MTQWRYIMGRGGAVKRVRKRADGQPPGQQPSRLHSARAKAYPRASSGHFVPSPPSARHLQVAEDLANGSSIKQAMLRAGYSESTASHGMDAFRHSSGLQAAWVIAAERKMAQPIPPLEVRRHNWIHQAEGDMHAGKVDRVPILRVVGQSLGMLQAENSIVVQVAALNVPDPGQDEPDAEPATLPDTVVTK